MTASQNPELTFAFERENELLHLRIGDSGKIKAGIVLTADQVEGVIDALVDLRSQMQPGVPVSYADASRRQMVEGSHFNFDVDADSGELLFSLRDAGRGWLTFRFAAALLERMSKIARSARGSSTKQ